MPVETCLGRRESLDALGACSPQVCERGDVFAIALVVMSNHVTNVTQLRRSHR